MLRCLSATEKEKPFGIQGSVKIFELNSCMSGLVHVNDSCSNSIQIGVVNGSTIHVTVENLAEPHYSKQKEDWNDNSNLFLISRGYSSCFQLQLTPTAAD